MSTTTDVLGRVLVDAIDEQPWYRRWSNTLTAACSLIVSLGVWVTATFTDLPPVVATVIGGVVALAGIVAQRQTRNGLTPTGARKTLDVIAPHVEETVRASSAQVLDRLQDTGRHIAEQVPPSWQDYLR